VSHAQLVGINGESSWWPACDPSAQPAKANAGPSGYRFGHYCTVDWARELNVMLSALRLCGADAESIEIRRRFLAQVAYETGYYSTLGQPADAGAGMIHMVPQNWQTNVEDMEAVFPGQGLLAAYQALGADGAAQAAFFQAPKYGWKSAAAWMARTNRVIGGCGLDLFFEPYDTMTRCILSYVVDRSEAYNLVGKHIQ
jgi:hypothetical protein